MTFLDFFEALVGCAEKYVNVIDDPITPHQSIPATPAVRSTVMSSNASQSRIASQVHLQEAYACGLFVYRKHVLQINDLMTKHYALLQLYNN